MTFRKMLLLLMLLMTGLVLTACYQEVDPWPASAGYAGQPAATATPMPTQTAPVVTPEPFATIAPTATPVPDMWGDEPTQVPGGSVEPGFNG